MNNPVEIKKIVRKKYAEIALFRDKASANACGCSCGCNDDELYNIMGDAYVNKKGYVSDADLGLGCGIPTDYAGIKEGQVILDLGSGAGNDVFIISRIIGDQGRVVGLDMTEEMILKANANKEKFRFKNVEFVFGEIEEMPLKDETFDVVVSNCVLNLVPDKNKAFSEIHRVLKTGGSFCVSDIVLDGELPKKFLTVAELYAGCITGASQFSEYMDIIKSAGFSDIKIHKQKVIDISDDVLLHYLNNEEVKEFKNSTSSIISVTVSAVK